MSGWQLAGYQVDELLGSGGSSQVWRARVVATGEPVALKRIAIGDAAQVRAAQGEAALLATLDHPHLIRLHELVPTGDALVLVLDLAPGGTLAELVACRGRITPGEAITALAPIGAALAYAHNAGVVHGDVTPSNVLFTETGMPLLADLGVARLLGDGGPVHSTPAFIDPAVARGCVPGPQSDVFMLGATTLQALTGVVLWRGDTPAAVLASAAAADTGGIEALLDTVDVPAEVRAVLARAVSVEPWLRGSAAEFALDLRHAGTPVAVELTAGPPRTRPAHSDPTRAGTGQPGDDGPTAPGDRASADSARPPFDRPAVPVPRPATPLLRHALRSHPSPRPARRAHRRSYGATRRRLVALAVGAALALAAAASWIGFGDGAGTKPGPAASTGVTLAGGPVGQSAPVPTPGTSTARPGTPQLTAAPPTSDAALDARGVSTVLAALDQHRQRAFADRDTALLAQVYAPGPLLSQDTALLERLVPAGCGLVGVHTSYDQIRITARDADRVVAALRARLAESALVCEGSARARAAGSGPSTLHIVLERHRSGYLIAAIGR